MSKRRAISRLLVGGGLLLVLLFSSGMAGSLHETNAAQPPSPPVQFPWDCGREFRLAQGNDAQRWEGRDANGSHAGRFALDFTMDEGTRIRAARAGIVRWVESDHAANIPFIRGRLPGNVVEVEHEDRTLLRYVHFQPGGVVV